MALNDFHCLPFGIWRVAWKKEDAFEWPDMEGWMDRGKKRFETLVIGGGFLILAKTLL